MVVNPIYETGAIYEEIPASIYKSQPTPTEKEEGYVSISSSAANSSGKCFLVRVHVVSVWEKIIYVSV